MDDADRADAQASEMLSRTIAHLASQRPLIRATGVCLNCGEVMDEDGRRWCDADCRDMWEKRGRK